MIAARDYSINFGECNMGILTGEKVFIIGAASGTGTSTFVAMAKAGGRLFLTDINQEGINQTCNLIKIVD